MVKDDSRLTNFRENALAIFKAALEAVEPREAVLSSLSRSGHVLRIISGKKLIKRFDLRKIDQIYLVGAGKASAPMAEAIEEVIGDRLSEGVVVVKTGHGLNLKKTTVLEASHPIPDEAGFEAAQKIKTLLEKAQPNDLVFSVISGGGSALLPLPANGLSLTDKQLVTQMLLGCGASIQEINAVRKHLSQVKGGQLAKAAAPAQVVNLMLSDVVGDDLDTIASGPFVPDRSTFQDVALILERYDLVKRIPVVVREYVERGVKGQAPETPKPGAPEFQKVINLIVGSNYKALLAAAGEAKKAGYRPLILSSYVTGETREVARVHAALAKEVRASGHPVRPPACLISGGETTVTLKGNGKGGRNQEFALAAAIELDGIKDVLLFSAGTDGTDGDTDAAGAMSDGNTCTRALQAGMSPSNHLESNDSYPIFARLGDLVITGPTRTNVMDIHLVIVA
jgi:glycerate 2-kinase